MLHETRSKTNITTLTKFQEGTECNLWTAIVYNAQVLYEFYFRKTYLISSLLFQFLCIFKFSYITLLASLRCHFNFSIFWVTAYSYCKPLLFVFFALFVLSFYFFEGIKRIFRYKVWFSRFLKDILRFLLSQNFSLT